MIAVLMSISVASILFFLLESMAGKGVSKNALRFGLGIVFMALILESILAILRGVS